MRKFTKLIIPTLFLFPCSFLFSQYTLSDNDRKAIMEVFTMQEDAWNEGNIPQFMEGYWKSDSLVFVGSNGPVYGWQATLERYEKAYPDRDAMGTLTFDILNIYPIESSSVFVIGKFYLKRKAEDLSGHFTLVWRKVDGRWVILSDHTS